MTDKPSNGVDDGQGEEDKRIECEGFAAGGPLFFLKFCVEDASDIMPC